MEKVKNQPADADTVAAEDDVEIVYETTKWWEDFRDFYFSIDRRTLGLARIFIGVFLLADLFRRTPDWFKMFANDGVLPVHYNLWRPQSNGYTLFNAFASHGELIVLWCVGLAIYLCYIVGYRTRVMQVLAAIYVASMNGRVLLIENGGYVVHNLLMLWTAFMPLGDRFSVDALATSLRHQNETSAAELNDRSTSIAAWRLKPFVSLVCLAILLQLCAIYAFNVIHKTGANWHNGTAVHFVFYVDRMVTPLIGILRDHVPALGFIVLTKWVLGMEAGLSLALLSPLARVWAKRIAILFVNLLHIGFGSTFVLGPFAWALCCFSVLLISPEDWQLGFATLRRVHRRRVVRFDPRSPSALFACRLLKRCDRFELLEYAEDRQAEGLEVTTPSGEKKRGLAARADIVAALPLGPVLVPPALLFGALLGPIIRLFFRARAHGAAPSKPELKDDVGFPTIDVYYAIDWLRDPVARRALGIAQPFVGLALIVIGTVLGLYAVPAAKSWFDVDPKALLFGEGWTRERVAAWLGGGLAVIGIFIAVRPFWVMNVRTPAPIGRKWLRCLSALREVTILLFGWGAMNQGLVELWVFKSWKIPQPEVPRVFSHKLRYLQGWFMFSPNPVMDDGTIVCDSVTVDGRRVDPFSTEWPDYSLRPPDMDLLHAKSYGYNQIWSDYFNRMHMAGNSAFRKPMKEYIFRLPERTGNPDDAIIKGICYWVADMNPPFTRREGRKTESFGYNRQELFRFSNPDEAVQKRYKEITGGKEPPPAPLPVDISEATAQTDGTQREGARREATP